MSKIKTAPVYLITMVKRHLIVEARSVQDAVLQVRDEDCFVLEASYSPPEEESDED